MRRVLLAVALLLAIAAPAHAAATPDPLAVFTKAAVTQWGGGSLPPCGMPHFLWSDSFPADADPTADGIADPQACTVTFKTSHWRDPYVGFAVNLGTWCLIVMHEMGHLYLGVGHTPTGIMAGHIIIPWRSFPPCARLLRTIMVCHHDGRWTICLQHIVLASDPRGPRP